MNTAHPLHLSPRQALNAVLHRLCRPFRRRLAAQAGRQTAVEAAEAEKPDDDAPRACGWFDSSHDLQHGLRVEEHLSADSLARELPLGAWLDLQLGSWRAAPLAEAAFTPAA